MNYNDINLIRVSEIRNLAICSYDALLQDYLNPKEPTDNLRYGTAIHYLILQQEVGALVDNVEILEFDNWRTKEAQEIKKSYENRDDSVVLLKKEYEAIMKTINISKPYLQDIFKDGEYEIPLQGELPNFGGFKGRIDCIKDDYIVDLKTTFQISSLDKKIFDMGYQLQMYLYMQLANRQSAKLVFFHTPTGLIEVKNLNYFMIAPECEALLKKAWDNKQKLEMFQVYNDIEIKESDYIPPQWALSELLTIEEEYND